MSVQQKRHFRQGLHNIYNMVPVALSENWGYSPMKNAMFMDFCGKTMKENHRIWIKLLDFPDDFQVSQVSPPVIHQLHQWGRPV